MIFDLPLNDPRDRAVSGPVHITPPSLWFWVKAGIGFAVGAGIVTVTAGVLWFLFWSSLILGLARSAR